MEKLEIFHTCSHLWAYHSFLRGVNSLTAVKTFNLLGGPVNATKLLRKTGNIPVTVTQEGLKIRDKVELVNSTGTTDFGYLSLIHI